MHVLGVTAGDEKTAKKYTTAAVSPGFQPLSRRYGMKHAKQPPYPHIKPHTTTH